MTPQSTHFGFSSFAPGEGLRFPRPPLCGSIPPRPTLPEPEEASEEENQQFLLILLLLVALFIVLF